MSENNYFRLAIDSSQYDSVNIDWKKEGLENSPSRILPQDYLQKYLNISDKKVIDIGCGMGQLFPLLINLSPKKIVGIDPSRKNIGVCKTLFPAIETIQVTLENYAPETKFDVALVVHTFEHIADVHFGLGKIFNLLDAKGYLYLIFIDQTYALTPRFDYDISSKEISKDIVVVKTKRSAGAMYDLLHSVPYYENSAESYFILKEHVEMRPTPRFLQAAPKYEKFKNIVISHLLILQKQIL